MKKKIVIIGALGYLGTELTRLYSGKSWYHKIIALDSRFFSNRVNQLKKWNIEFHQGTILDNEFLKKHLNGADIIFHLAGVTNVAYVRDDSNDKLDNKIKTVAITGTNNIINNSPKNSKIIFPSTHVVFEGLRKPKKNLTEKDKTFPILMYSKSKLENEFDIIKSKRNYIILRLGSVYGFSGDSTRIKIMPNLFSKMSALGETINLFSGGKQLKSLVNIIDVVRCMQFMEENEHINNETFNLVNEQTSVKKVALICKKINPTTNIKVSNDKVPNNGYTLSNKKILKTGFKFLYSLENSIKDMIEKWKYSKDPRNLEQIYSSENEFSDRRGKISNYHLPEPINLIGSITSKFGSVRANHFHPIQEQKVLLIKGRFISIYKDLLSSKPKTVTHVVNEGDLIVTKPYVAHAMVFTKDSIFLNLVNGEREHKNYGVTHTFPYQLVDKKIKKDLISFYKFDCRCCGNIKLKRIISLGFQPLANNLINNKKNKFDTYPLELNYCEDCRNVQLSVSVLNKKMFKKYFYLSSASKELINHFRDAALKYKKELSLNLNSKILDVGSNDGIGLKPFYDAGYKNLVGIEPASNVAKIANKKGIKTINKFLNYTSIRKIKSKFDLILASNVFAHGDNLKEIADCMLRLLNKKGTLIIEVQYLMDMLKKFTFDNIYHEHFNYWSLTSLQKFFSILNAEIYKVEKIKTHGGSIRVYIHKNGNKKVHRSVKKIISEETVLKNNQIFLKFNSEINKIKTNVISNLDTFKKKYKNVYGFGAPAKATTALNFFGINSDDIKNVFEDNKLKHNKIIPGTNIKIIKTKKNIKSDELLIVFAWNYFDSIRKKFPNVKNVISLRDLFNEPAR